MSVNRRRLIISSSRDDNSLSQCSTQVTFHYTDDAKWVNKCERQIARQDLFEKFRSFSCCRRASQILQRKHAALSLVKYTHISHAHVVCLRGLSHLQQTSTAAAANKLKRKKDETFLWKSTHGKVVPRFARNFSAFILLKHNKSLPSWTEWLTKLFTNFSTFRVAPHTSVCRVLWTCDFCHIQLCLFLLLIRIS